MSITTEHRIIMGDVGKVLAMPEGSVDLVVTSPPYPMIEMWDALFCSRNAGIDRNLKHGKGMQAFELMHRNLDTVWKQIYRVLKPGGFACINIGDATRKIGDDFCLYANHARILQYLMKLGFSVLPDILWRKQTNSPTKFMGSGMLPAGAYVTLEHEYILIVRKGSKREFLKEEEKINRRQSAIFWEERNEFFSDVWTDLKGTVQRLKKKEARSRSGAFPFELAYRLINMYSVKGDTVLDPFVGTGTTMAAAMTACRNSVGVEIDPTFLPTIHGTVEGIVRFSNQRIEKRLEEHLRFVRERRDQDKSLKYMSRFYGFPVVTNQEKELLINALIEICRLDDNRYEIQYSGKPQPAFCVEGDVVMRKPPVDSLGKKPQKKSAQLFLFDGK